MTVKNFHDEELRTKLQEMFSEIGFEGIFSIEFLRDKNDKLYFLEINFRNSTWSYASTKAGMPLPILWAQGMLDSSSVDNCIKEIPPEGFVAIVEPADFKARVMKKKIGLFKWIGEIMRCKCLYYINRHDMKPVCFRAFSKLCQIITGKNNDKA